VDRRNRCRRSDKCCSSPSAHCGVDRVGHAQPSNIRGCPADVVGSDVGLLLYAGISRLEGGSDGGAAIRVAFLQCDRILLRFPFPAVVTIHSERESNKSTLRQVVTRSQDYPYSSSQEPLSSPEESICGVQSSRLGRMCDLRCVNCAKHRDSRLWQYWRWLWA